MSEDLLKKYSAEIESAEALEYTEMANWQSSRLCECIRDLAADVTTLRKERSEDDARYMKALERIANADDEIERLRARVAERDSQISNLVRIHKDSVDEMVAHMDELRARVAELENVERKAIEQSEYIQVTEYEVAGLTARVAELEKDAKLGRLVREMEEGTSLHHNSNGYDEWSYGPVPNRGYTWEATPEAALEAAQKEAGP